VPVSCWEDSDCLPGWTCHGVCHPQCGNGICEAGEPGPVCPTDCPAGIPCYANADCPNDWNPCTDDRCDLGTGNCAYETLPEFSPCSYAACAPGGYCGGGTCMGTAMLCDDGNVCTKDLCDLESGECLYTPYSGTPVWHGFTGLSETTCDDGIPCTDNDTCVAGACAGAAIECDDGNLCTVDSCDPLSGTCAHSALTCDDDNACTTDSCDPSTGCINAATSAPGCQPSIKLTSPVLANSPTGREILIPESSPSIVLAGEINEPSGLADARIEIDGVLFASLSGGVFSIPIQFDASGYGVETRHQVRVSATDTQGNIIVLRLPVSIQHPYARNRIALRFNDGVTDEQKKTFLGSFNGKVVRMDASGDLVVFIPHTQDIDAFVRQYSTASILRWLTAIRPLVADSLPPTSDPIVNTAWPNWYLSAKSLIPGNFDYIQNGLLPPEALQARCYLDGSQPVCALGSHCAIVDWDANISIPPGTCICDDDAFCGSNRICVKQDADHFLGACLL